LADNANREGVAERFPPPAVQKRVEGALALLDSSDRLRSAVELTIVQTAKQHQAQTLYRRPSVPGIGTMLRLVLRDESQDLARFPRVQEFVSSCRLITCAKEAAGKRDGTSGAKLGHASLKWAFSEAAVVVLRNTPAGQQDLARWEKHQGKGKAFTVFAPTLARAVYSMLPRDTVVDMQKCRKG
jgi:transposase